jgi:hypothetical protein
MADFWEIVKMILPALLVLLMAYLFFQRMKSMPNAAVTTNTDNVERMKLVLPLKISAYERLIVMLERITPNSLVMRCNRGQINAGQLQLELLKSIREEFEHNVGLQMYVSSRAWQAVVAARQETSQMVKVAATKINLESPSISLSQEIFILEEKVSNSAIDIAKKMLKLEIAASF